ncbi:pilin [Xanthomonas sp. CFBP 8703]|uniref:Pilin n=1 Tax=Xanthomonas bonasiae TaxID=2810351 RepID=A0ABS3B243_9XANT|nr:pilin [Xanthomonas bonasiae]MBN6102134.1 pilin [Xanthomonas bonasiae]
MRDQKGFSLIELMMVIAIAAVLSAIALQGYTNYVSRSQVVAALSEIRGGQTGLEAAFNEGRGSDVSASYIGLSSSARCPEITASVDAATGVGGISCVLAGNDLVAGTTLSLRRSTSGVWSCDGSDMPEKYRPEGCG